MNLYVTVEVKEWKLRGECYFVNNSILIGYDPLPSMALAENLQSGFDHPMTASSPSSE